MKRDDSKRAFEGTWEPQDEDYRTVTDIKLVDKQWEIRVYDKIDGEEFEVRNIVYKKGELSYEVHVLRSGYVSRSKLKIQDGDILVNEITLCEHMKRVK